MNVFQLSRAEINWRLALYVVLAVDSFLLSNEWFTKTVPPAWMVILGAINAGLVVVRAYIDKSPAQGESAGPVEVTTPPGEPLETQEVGLQPIVEKDTLGALKRDVADVYKAPETPVDF